MMRGLLKKYFKKSLNIAPRTPEKHSTKYPGISSINAARALKTILKNPQLLTQGARKIFLESPQYELRGPL